MKTLEVGFILKKINPKIPRRKGEVECTFLLHGMNSVTFSCPPKLQSSLFKEEIFSKNREDLVQNFIFLEIFF
jgi:hypothetical protein